MAYGGDYATSAVLAVILSRELRCLRTNVITQLGQTMKRSLGFEEEKKDLEGRGIE